MAFDKMPISLSHPTMSYAILIQKWAERRHVRLLFSQTLCIVLFLPPLIYVTPSVPEVGYGRGGEADTVQSRVQVIPGTPQACNAC